MNQNSEQYPNWEAVFGCSISLLAAVLAVTDLGAGRYGDDELRWSNEKTAQYLWYQAKGIKENLEEGRIQTLQALVTSGSITSDAKASLSRMQEEAKNNITRYKKERKEILMGSHTVGRENWAQDLDGKLGQVIGAKEMEQKLEVLGAAGDNFDVANLCLQISLVIGAVGIMSKKDQLKKVFFIVMVFLGIAGVIFSAMAYNQAISA